MNKAIFWFRRDLRLNDNTGLLKAISENDQVMPIFIFDELILNELPQNDPRICFIYERLRKIDEELRTYGSGLSILKGDPLKVWNELLKKESITVEISLKILLTFNIRIHFFQLRTREACILTCLNI